MFGSNDITVSVLIVIFKIVYRLLLTPAVVILWLVLLGKHLDVAVEDGYLVVHLVPLGNLLEDLDG